MHSENGTYIFVSVPSTNFTSFQMGVSGSFGIYLRDENFPRHSTLSLLFIRLCLLRTVSELGVPVYFHPIMDHVETQRKFKLYLEANVNLNRC